MRKDDPNKNLGYEILINSDIHHWGFDWTAWTSLGKEFRSSDGLSGKVVYTWKDLDNLDLDTILHYRFTGFPTKSTDCPIQNLATVSAAALASYQTCPSCYRLILSIEEQTCLWNILHRTADERLFASQMSISPSPSSVPHVSEPKVKCGESGR